MNFFCFCILDFRGLTTLCKGISINCPSISESYLTDKTTTSAEPTIAPTIPRSSAKSVSHRKRIALPFKLNSIDNKYDAFVKSLFEISDKISYPPYSNALIIGKKQLLTQEILAAQVEAYVIYEDLTTISKETMAKFLEKVRKLKREFTVCCLFFDLSSVSTTVTSPSACSLYDCNETLQSTFREVSSSNCHIVRIYNIIKALSSVLPVIVFPLFPAEVFVPDSSTKMRHKSAHKIINANENLFVIDKKSLFCINKSWNKLLKNQHKSNVCHPFMLNFVDCGGTPFYCQRANIHKAQHHFSKKILWMAFSCIVLQTCVRSGKITIYPYPMILAPASTSSLNKSKSYLNVVSGIVYLMF